MSRIEGIEEDEIFNLVKNQENFLFNCLKQIKLNKKLS